MTQLKEKALHMIEQIPEDRMLYVVKFLEKIDTHSKDTEHEQMEAMKAFDELLSFEKRLSGDFDMKKELTDARDEKYSSFG